MEGLKTKKGYTNFELSCCLESIIDQYEAQIKEGNCRRGKECSSDPNSEYFSATVQNHSDFDQNRSEEEIRDQIAMLSELRECINHKKEDLLSPKSEGTSNSVRYSILDVLELDRKRIARDLHDSSVQLLTMLVHKAELCEKLIEIDTIRTKMELHTMGEVLKDAISELRQTIFDLRPMTMDDLGLMDSIERYIQMLIQSSEIQFCITVVNDEDYDIEQMLKPVQKLSIYRILQECCSNIIKHSKATKALITLKLEDACIYLQVDDNGVGFKEQQKILKINEMNETLNNNKDECLEVLTSMLCSRADFTGYGLSMLYERVYLLDGVVNIYTGNDGTSIRVRIPTDINEEEVYEID